MAVSATMIVSVTHARADQGLPAGLSPDEMYFTVQPATVELVAVENSVGDSGIGDLALLPEAGPADGIAGGLNEAEVVLDRVINIGKKVWAIIEANRPVVNIQTDSANALPEGARAWQNLSGWSAPQSRVYRVTYKNLFGVTVVGFSYRVLFTPGGNVNGKGRYLTQVAILPAALDVAWGYSFDMNAAVPSVTNAGSAENPVGAAQLLLSWKVSTPLKHSQNTQSFYVQGDGQFLDLSNGTP